MAVTRIEDVVNKDDEEPLANAAASARPEADGRLATVGKKRTRTGGGREAVYSGCDTTVFLDGDVDTTLQR